jgi:hypothetical protein
MGRAENRNRSQAAAAYMVAQGIFHGMRRAKPNPHNNMPVNEPGSAAYRRLQKAIRGKNSK